MFIRIYRRNFPVLFHNFLNEAQTNLHAQSYNCWPPSVVD